MIEKRREYVIYGLIDPNTKELRYVGKSINGIKRAYEHNTKSGLKLRDHCHNWLRGLAASGHKPDAFIIETLNSNVELNEAESFWIGYFRSIGCRLTNKTNGGDGCSGPMPQEIRDKLSKALKGRKKSQETIERMRMAAFNRSQHHIDSLRGLKRSDETKKKMSDSKKGRLLSLETREKISLKLKMKPFDSQRSAQLSLAREIKKAKLRND